MTPISPIKTVPTLQNPSGGSYRLVYKVWWRLVSFWLSGYSRWCWCYVMVVFLWYWIHNIYRLARPRHWRHQAKSRLKHCHACRLLATLRAFKTCLLALQLLAPRVGVTLYERKFKSTNTFVRAVLIVFICKQPFAFYYSAFWILSNAMLKKLLHFTMWNNLKIFEFLIQINIFPITWCKQM